MSKTRGDKPIRLAVPTKAMPIDWVNVGFVQAALA